MKRLYIDFETYYDTEYSLRKLSVIEYVRDERFKVHCVAVDVGEEVRVYSAEEFAQYVQQFDWSQFEVIAHNIQFDGFILAERYSVSPGKWGCSMQLARMVLGRRAQNFSLDYLCDRLHIGHKIEGALLNTMGKRALLQSEYDTLAQYCAQDVRLCRALYEKLLTQHPPEKELRLLDQAVRCMTEPELLLDEALLAAYHKELHDEREDALSRTGVTATALRSRKQFSALLRDAGVEPPTKISPRTGKETYAFAKTDEDFLALLDHPSRRVRDLVNAKLLISGGNAVTRAERLLRIGSPLPVPLLFWGAHTGRFSGTGSKINLQNMNRGSKLREAVMAPPGQLCVVGDLSQVEMRVNAAFCNEQLLLRELASGEDVYCQFASRVFGRPITKEDKLERFLGKTCQLGLGYGTGAEKLRATLKLRSEKQINLSLEDAQEIVQLWRRTYSAIPKMWWGPLEEAIKVMAGHRRGEFEVGPVVFSKGRMRLPNETFIYYPQLRWDREEGEWRWRHGKLYGAKLLENIVQALARIIMTDAWLRLVDQGQRVKLTVHDELLLLADEAEAGFWAKKMEEAFTQPPDWLPQVPLAAEVGIGERWSDAK